MSFIPTHALLVAFSGGTLEQFGELVRRIAAHTFDADGSPQLLVTWRPDDDDALVLELPSECFRSPEAKDALGAVLASLGACGVAMVAVISEGWYPVPGTPAFDEHRRSDRSLHEIREAGIDGVGEKLMAWLGDSEAQAAWVAEIERDESSARLARWQLWGSTESRWHAWFRAGVERAERAGADS